MQNLEKNQNNLSYSQFGKFLDRKIFATKATNIQKSISPTNKSQNPQQSPRLNKKILYGNTNIKKNHNTSAFTSVSRQKKSNFRFPIRLCKQEIKYQPNYFYCKQKLPHYSFSKSQKVPREKVVQYQLCQKNPLAKKLSKQSILPKQQLSPIRTLLHSHNKFPSTRNTNSIFTKSVSDKMNYSILIQKEPSFVGRYAKSKIQSPLYLSKTDLMITQIKDHIENSGQKKLGNTYIEMQKYKGRLPNVNKSFYLTEDHFNNFQFHHNIPQKIHKFESYTNRLEFKPIQSPNYDILKINLDKVKQNTKRGNIKFQTYRDSIKTRYDRVEPQPFTKLSYQYQSQILPNVRKSPDFNMTKTLFRKSELFPIIDPNLKKSGDKIMTNQLKKQVKINQKNDFFI